MNRRGFLALSATALALPRVACASDIGATLAAVKDADHIAIGEIHDNPGHHRLQVELVAALAPAGLAFEMIPSAQEGTVNAMRRDGASSDDLKALLEKEAPGWEWDAYLPIMAAAPREAHIAGGGLSRDELGAIYGQGPQGLGPEMTARYDLDAPLPDDTRAEMLDEQFSAHCEMIEREKLGAMIAVQRAWDASYAEAWRRAGQKGDGLAILICGNAHARLDRGAPSYLLRAEPQAVVASIGMLEDGEVASTGQYTTTLSAPAPDRVDPCEQMRKAMEKKG